MFEDILNHINCQPWAEMTGAELEDCIFGMVMRVNRSLVTVLRSQNSIYLTYWIRYEYMQQIYLVNSEDSRKHKLGYR